MVNGLANVTDNAPLSLARFNDTRCVDDCVDSTDPLLFTCELKNVPLLRFLLPNGYHVSLSEGSTIDNTLGIHNLPIGFRAESVIVSEADNGKMNISLTLSIANASLLDGGEILCSSTTPKNSWLMAGCPVCGKF